MNTRVDQSRVSATSWVGIALCGLVGFVDGFDTQALSPSAGTIAETLGFPVSQLGFVFSASQVGFLLGALVLGPLGDRLGRKRVLIGCVALFGLCSLLTALADSYALLVIARLIGGVGLGGATPNFISLASEYAPPARRERVVTMMWAAVPLGGMSSALVSGALLPTLGWQSVFVIGCAAPIILIPLLAVILPGSREALPASASDRPGLSVLFGPGQTAATIWLWLASFATWLTLIVIVFWTPTLLGAAGLSTRASASMLAVHNIGGIIGTLVIGALIGRLRAVIALLLSLGASSLAIVLMAATLQTPALLSVATATAGFFGSAAGATLLAVASASYPPQARATGVAFALVAGRIGTILGPIMIGSIVAAHWHAAAIFLTIAIAPAIAAICVVFMLKAQRALPSGE
jgi:AAHS family 4-hydroxybenzoate transporter-like MFS transporter